MKINESRLTFSTALAHIVSFLLALLLLLGVTLRVKRVGLDPDLLAIDNSVVMVFLFL